jgi:site-specific recombinase XerD
MDVPIPLFDSLDQFEKTPPALKLSIPASAAIEADYQLAYAFLYSYRGSEATFNSYRREIERLLQWCWLIANKTLQQLRRADFETYIEFCQKPPLTWIGTKQISRFIVRAGERIANPDWRPFVATVDKVAHRKGEAPDPKKYVLSQKALQAIFGVCSSFFNYLIQEEYTEANPVLQIRQKSKFIRKHQGPAIIRRLSELQWGYVLEVAESMANANPEVHERTLFIMNVLYGMYLRISELAASARWEPQMGHFKQDSDGNWWFTTVGKGNKERIISVSNAMLEALKRYRLALGLSRLPHVAETTPLLANQTTGEPIRSTRYIREIVQNCFDAAVEKLRHENFQDEADQLMAATVHWLRHTGISDDVKHRPREHVRDDAGHGSSAITDRYIDIELRARHASAKNKTIKPESWDATLATDKADT